MLREGQAGPLRELEGITEETDVAARVSRAVAYFCYRYFLRLGFLNGRPGWRWHFWQGL